MENIQEWLRGHGQDYSLEQLKNLRVLKLDGKYIREIPESIGDLSNLQYLYLGNNLISELPPTVGNLKNLERLYLRKNQIGELPGSLCELSNLQHLYLGVDQIELLKSIEKLSSLKQLFLHVYCNKQIRKLPPSIVRLKNLRGLWLTYINFTKLPYPIKKLRDVRISKPYWNIMQISFITKNKNVIDILLPNQELL